MKNRRVKKERKKKKDEKEKKKVFKKTVSTKKLAAKMKKLLDEYQEVMRVIENKCTMESLYLPSR